MTDDLISRMDAVQATRVGPSDEWSRDTKGGYELAATDCMMNILKVPPADLSSPLGAVAMREAAAAVCDRTTISRQAQMNGADHKDDALQQERWRVGKQQAEILAESIRALPLPDHAALLAAAMKLPEVAAMVEALDYMCIIAKQDDWGKSLSGRQLVYRNSCAALAALEAKP